jgi:hypothetical protein
MVRFFIKIVILILLSNKVYAEQIDICEDNYSCKKTYQYNYLDFNFNSGVIEHRYKFSPELQKNFQSYYEIERKFKIIKIDEDGITFDQSFKSHFELQHKMFLDDKYLIGSNFYKNTFEKKVNESGGVESSWYRVKIFPKEKIIEEIYWPLTQEPQKKIIKQISRHTLIVDYSLKVLSCIKLFSTSRFLTNLYFIQYSVKSVLKLLRLIFTFALLDTIIINIYY